jgi:LysM repeat protein
MLTRNLKYLLFTITGTLLSIYLTAQPAEKNFTRNQYINMYSEEAIDQMIKYKIPASITLAQGVLESSNGNSVLAKYSNNHFGIKCHGWNGEKSYHDDDKKNECFRKYNSAYQSFEDHSIFLTQHKRYSMLFDLNIHDYKNWAKGLKKAGYATNPKYADLLIKIIEANELYQYDKPFELAENRSSNSVRTKHSVSEIKQYKHVIKVHDNNIKYIIINNNDTYYKIAKEFEMGLWQIYKYNDLNKNDILQYGDIIFLQPKRNKSKSLIHLFKKGDSMKSISQLYGIKLKKLYKKNKIPFGTDPKIGDKIYLSKSIK